MEDCFKYRKAMLRRELLPFLPLKDVISMIKLDKASFSCFRSVLKDRKERWHISQEDWLIMVNEMIKDTFTDGQVVKVRGDFNYGRYNPAFDTFEVLAYAGAGYPWTNDERYYRGADLQSATFGRKIY